MTANSPKRGEITRKDSIEFSLAHMLRFVKLDAEGEGVLERSVGDLNMRRDLL
jgi:hypothetical protein